jgi:hypothetical protein
MTIDLSQTVWGKRIAAAARHGFTVRDRSEANDWPTCACGKATADIPRHGEGYSVGQPYDLDLLALGMKFGEAVDCDETEEAWALLERIELRARVVAAENRK